jgi:hypothetical protein
MPMLETVLKLVQLLKKKIYRFYWMDNADFIFSGTRGIWTLDLTIISQVLYHSAYRRLPRAQSYKTFSVRNLRIFECLSLTSLV